MKIMESIENTLTENNNLTSEVKQNLLELTGIFHKQYPEVSLENLNERLKTLKIKRISKFLNRDISMYDFRTNTLYFNKSEMEKPYDMKHVLMFELLNIITATNYHTGFNLDNKFEALNIGYTEMLANLLVGNDSDIWIYADEAIEANLISIIVGVENLEKAYFNNDAKLLIKSFMEIGVQV